MSETADTLSRLRSEERARLEAGLLQRRRAARAADPTLGWGELVRGRVAIHEFPGSHSLMVKPPAVHVLVDQLRACLDDVSPEADAV